MKPILANIALCILLINSNVTITAIFKFNKNPSNYSPNSRGFLKTILWLLQTSTTLLMSYKFNFQNVYSIPENSVEWIITPFVSYAPARKKLALYMEYFRLRLPNFFNSENSYYPNHQLKEKCFIFQERIKHNSNVKFYCSI